MQVNSKYMNYQLPMLYGNDYYIPNYTMPGNPEVLGGPQVGQAVKPNIFAQLFAKLKGLGGKASGALQSKGINMTSLSGLNDMHHNLVSKPLLGIQGLPSIATVSNVASGGIQGVQAAKGLFENAQTDKDLGDMKKDITSAIATNPMYDMYLDSSDEKLLRQLRNGRLEDDKVNGMVQGALQGLPKALLSAGLGYLTGNVPGAIIGGVGSLANAGIQGYGQGAAETQAKLQSLYAKLQQAQDEYRTMKRPRGLYGAGLQSRYFNQLY